jgi:hypothetical protein
MGFFPRSIAVALSALLVMPASALAQRPETGTAVSSADVRSGNRPGDDLPVSLDRIRRQLAVTPTRTRSSKAGLRLEYYVDVYGRAPRLELFLPTEHITNAPVMYGGMTHQEFLQVITPQEFKAPPADIGSAVAALVKWLSDKQKNGQTSKR